MSSRRPGRALRSALVCLAVLALSGGAALASEPTSAEPPSEVLAPAPDAETLTTSTAPSAAVHAAPDPAEPRQAPAKDWLSTAMNAGAIAFCMWMLALLWRPGLGRSLLSSRPGRR